MVRADRDLQMVAWEPPVEITHNDLRLATGTQFGGNSGVNGLYLLTYPVEGDDDEER